MSDISDRFLGGEDVQSIARDYGLKPSIIRARLRAMNIDVDREPASVWEMDEDRRREEFRRRSSLAAGVALREGESA